MSPFEHLSVLISIIIGLGIARLLSRVALLVQARNRVQLYWLSLLWAGLVFTVQVEWWWASFEFRQQMEWNFFYFLFVLLSPVTLYLAATLVLPEIKDGESYSLRDHYLRTRTWLFMFLALSTALDAMRRAMQSGIEDIGVWSNLLATGLIGSLAVVESQLYHAFVSLLLSGVFLYFIVSSAIQLG
jgi:hypothetical protein